jgi:hypothetical protein
MIESEVSFRIWLRSERMLKDMSDKELECLAESGQWPSRPEPAPGASPLDSMDRPALIKLWKESLQFFAGRTRSELEFYVVNGYWPEEAAKDGFANVIPKC